MGLHGWRLVSLIGAALLGGYLLATSAGIFLGSILPHSRSEATLIANLLSFAIYTGAIIWVFHLRKPGVAWLALSLASAALSLAGLALRG
ncbi:hypothetical protein [Microbulbifer taiwanensis]|uniref:DUF3649 domain-containing protein n=1 Tax=Microbulbifer taiwanensis TaxID=986746 RepID=A0ABW1YI21_9GAMM|nr:hypothetical protein [Microbulbifer taiwanensis]